MKNISFLNLKIVKESSGRYDVERINSPENAYKSIETLFDLSNRSEEYLVMLTLDNKNKITGAFTVSQGSINKSVVHPREVFKRALMNNAAAIIIAHNHPSGDLTPSQEDINTTRRLEECGKLIGIELLDHIVVGQDGYKSLKERRLL